MNKRLLLLIAGVLAASGSGEAAATCSATQCTGLVSRFTISPGFTQIFIGTGQAANIDVCDATDGAGQTAIFNLEQSHDHYQEIFQILVAARALGEAVTILPSSGPGRCRLSVIVWQGPL